MTKKQNEWYQKNKERILEQRKQEYQQSPEKFKEKSIDNYYSNHQENLDKRKRTRVRDKEKLSAAAKTRWRSMSTEEKILKRVKERVRTQNLPFNLELSDIIIPKYCPIFNIPLFTSDKVGPNTPSIDRVLNNLGYVKGNIRIISMKANSMKGAMTIDECETLLRYMKGEL